MVSGGKVYVRFLSQLIKTQSFASGFSEVKFYSFNMARRFQFSLGITIFLREKEDNDYAKFREVYVKW